MDLFSSGGLKSQFITRHTDGISHHRSNRRWENRLKGKKGEGMDIKGFLWNSALTEFTFHRFQGGGFFSITRREKWKWNWKWKLREAG